MLLANNYNNNINLIYLGLSKACEHDEECKDICEGFKGYCNTKEGTCVCEGGKFSEKFSPGHHSKSDNN